MALPSSGSIGAAQINTELGRASTASFSLNGTEERALAGKPSGSIGFSDFHGKSSEIAVNMVTGGATITLESLFSPADWTSETTKRVILPAGVERGNSANNNAAVTIGSTAWGGVLIFDVKGTISGKGGAANSGVGGDAFHANRVGNANQKLQLTLFAGAVLRGGGGGGGKGGNGGDGSNLITTREPASGYRWTNTGEGSTGTGLYVFAFDDYWATIRWNNALIDTGQHFGQPGSSSYAAPDGWTYEFGNIKYTYGIGVWDFEIARSKTTGGSTTGGIGGAGGTGEGYGQARTAGTAGSAGGTNAGTGGTGGTGGLYGTSGATGATGTNGNVTNGSAGSAGGLAGYGLLGSANVTLTNNGSILGRTG